MPTKLNEFSKSSDNPPATYNDGLEDLPFPSSREPNGQNDPEKYGRVGKKLAEGWAWHVSQSRRRNPGTVAAKKDEHATVVVRER